MHRHRYASAVRDRAFVAGQTMAEYAVVLGIITAIIVATFAVLSGQVDAALQKAASVI